MSGTCRRCLPLAFCSGRDAAFFFSGLFSAVLLSALACLALYVKKWWQLRRHYSRQMEHELEEMDGVDGARVSSRGGDEGDMGGSQRGGGGRGVKGPFSMSRFRSEATPVREAFEDEP